jgi:hypothetical protein
MGKPGDGGYIAVRLRVCLIDCHNKCPFVYVSGVPDWVKHYEKFSPSQVLQIHIQTDGNDIRPHTAQVYNERTSTYLNLVTA